jgi:hypothetical protein
VPGFAAFFLFVFFFQIVAARPADAGLGEFKPLLALLAGELRGAFTPVEGRPVEWHLTMAPASGGLRTGEVVITGADISARIALEYEPAIDRFRWRAVEGRLDLGAWVPALATRPDLSSVLSGLSATGIITLTGEGAWENGKATGGLRVELKDGTVRNETEGWALEGVTLQGGGDAAGLFAGIVPIEVGVRTIGTSRFGARALTISGRLKDFEQIEMTAARVEIAGGEVTAEPFAVSLAAPAVSVTLAMERVGLQDLVVFVPTTLSEARGRINGRLNLKWNPTDGVEVGEGSLSLEKSEPTVLRLVSTPGFFTEKVPARFTFLPPGFGILARWFSSPNDAYGALSEIERGKVALRVEVLDVRLTPEGDERGRSASVIIRARPERKGGVIDEVTFEINVAGPLAEVLRLGMQQNLSLQMP